jgi:hypothetical protein
MKYDSELYAEISDEFSWFDEENNFLVPDYREKCLSNIPWFLLETLTAKRQVRTLPEELFSGIEKERFEKVILILIDGFGFYQLLEHKEGLFKRIGKLACINPITTVFPSTTAAALTSLSTGLTPQEHGLIEWYIYLEEAKEIIASLLFSPLGSRGRDLLADKFSPRILFDGRTFYSDLAKSDVKSFVFLGRNIARSSYSKVAYRGSELVPYTSSSDMFVNLRRVLGQVAEKSYYQVYWSTVDTMEHTYGPSFEGSKLELELFMHSFFDGFIDRLDKKQARNTLLIITSDHGQIDIEPEKTIYLNRFRKLQEKFRKNPDGKLIEPTGSARDVFLHVEDVGSTIAYLQKKFNGKALVVDTAEAMTKGLFGMGKKSDKFMKRLGQILLLPYSNNTVWYKFANLGKLDLRGHHGSLTPTELIVPFIAVDLEKLI